MSKKGPKLSLDERKLKILFKVMQKAPTYKYIAYSLGVSKTETIKQWYTTGCYLMNQFEDELSELETLLPMDYILIFEDRQEEYTNEFKILYGVEDDKPIPDRLWGKYNDFLTDEKNNFVESNLQRREKEILNSIKLNEDEELDKEFKLYIRFARIYNRAKCSLEIDLLNSVTRNGKSAKNAQLGFKLLQTYNKEDFGETQTVNHIGTISVNDNSILSMALLWEKQQKDKMKQIESKNDNVIDVKPTSLLEVKKEEE